MEIVKIPKKLRDVFAVLRSGQIESGLNQLDQIPAGFETQKNVALAEILYFEEKYDRAMTCDEMALFFDEEWYAGNVLSEHFRAYAKAALVSGNVKRAESFFRAFMQQKESLDLPEHQIKRYRCLVDAYLQALQEGKLLNQLLPVINEGQTEDHFVAFLKDKRPKLAYNSLEGASYLLNFMFEKGNTTYVLNYYENYATELRNEFFHIKAARLYNAIGEKEKSRKALLEYALTRWCPVEWFQIVPMPLFQYDDLDTVLTTELKNEILNSPKAPGLVATHKS